MDPVQALAAQRLGAVKRLGVCVAIERLDDVRCVHGLCLLLGTSVLA